LMGDEWRDNGLIFPDAHGRPIDPARISNALHRALERAGLPRVRVHDLRHTAATLLLARGVHPKVVQEMLGHSTISLTLDTYSHSTPTLHAEAASHMDGLFAGCSTVAVSPISEPTSAEQKREQWRASESLSEQTQTHIANLAGMPAR